MRTPYQIKMQLLASDFDNEGVLERLRKPFYRLFLGYDAKGGKHRLEGFSDDEIDAKQISSRHLCDMFLARGWQAEYDHCMPHAQVFTDGAYGMAKNATVYVVECRSDNARYKAAARARARIGM